MKIDVDERQLSAESPDEIDCASRSVDCALGVWLLRKLPRSNPTSLVSVVRLDVLFEPQPAA